MLSWTTNRSGERKVSACHSGFSSLPISFWRAQARVLSFLPRAAPFAMRCGGLRARRETSRFCRAVFLASPFLLCLASICLLFDLGGPQRALLAFCDPFGSVLSFGACCLGLLTVVSIAVAALGIAEKFPVLFMRTGCALGIVLVPLVMGYTGVLLCDLVAVDFWNTPLLAVLFVCSSLSTGYASCMLVHALLRPLAPSAMCLMGVLARVLHIAEGIVLVFFMIGRFLYSAAARESVLSLLCGGLAPVFWAGVVLCGLLIPVAACSIRLRAVSSPPARIVVSSCALIGGFALRYAIVSAACYTAIVAPIL